MSEATNGGTTKAITRSKLGDLQKMLETNKAQLLAALPSHMTPERMIRVAVTAYSKTKALQECSLLSICQCVMSASQLGLEPDGVLGHAYLVPFYNNKTKQKECQLIPGYRGLIELGRRSGHLISIQAHVVYEKDHFDLKYGIEDKLEHTPYMKGDPGKPYAVWAKAQFKDGGMAVDLMSWAQIMKVRDRSKAKESGPWVTDTEEMAKKTVLKRLLKTCPMSVELANAIDSDNKVEMPDLSAIPAFATEVEEEADGSGEGQGVVTRFDTIHDAAEVGRIYAFCKKKYGYSSEQVDSRVADMRSAGESLQSIVALFRKDMASDDPGPQDSATPAAGDETTQAAPKKTNGKNGGGKTTELEY